MKGIELELLALIVLVSLIFTVGVTEKVRRALISRAMLDVPNDRSSHKAPVPRGGGLAILALLLPAMALGSIFIDKNAQHLPLIAATALLGCISWIDDRKNVSPALRLLTHFAAAWLGSLSFSPQETVFSGILPYWLDRTAMIVGWAWFINLYNFMDGIDGITGVETTSIAAGAIAIALAAGIGETYAVFVMLALVGASLGFLVHNWHPAKIFLGDIGSIPLGFIVGFGLLSIAVNGHLIAALILPLYYIADSSITITRRALRGEKIWQAHREHFYQKAALGAGSHSKVVLYIAAGNACLIAAAMLSLTCPISGLCASIVTVTILLFLLQNLSLKQKET